MKRPPLTLPQLREIQQRNLPNKDVMTLLREIKRLHELVIHADFYALEMQARVPGAAEHDATGVILRRLANEPCAVEYRLEQREREAKLSVISSPAQ